MNKAAIYLWCFVALQALAFVMGSLMLGGSHWNSGTRSSRARIMVAHRDFTGGLKTGLESFKADCGRYPTTAEGFKILVSRPGDISSKNWLGPYFDTIPIDPWGHEYCYRFPAIHSTNDFDLYSCGADGVSKTDGNDLDDVNSWDPDSPKGEALRESEDAAYQFFTVALLLVTPFFCGIRVVVGLLSARARGFLMENRLVDRIWLLLAVIALFLTLGAVAPRL